MSDSSSSEIPNSSDCISRRAAIDSVLKLTYADGAYGYADAKELVDSLEALPSAQPERKTGRWIDDNCSECGQYVFRGDVRNFCPSCGAKMENDS